MFSGEAPLRKVSWSVECTLQNTLKFLERAALENTPENAGVSNFLIGDICFPLLYFQCDLTLACHLFFRVKDISHLPNMSHSKYKPYIFEEYSINFHFQSNSKYREKAV